MDTIEQMDLSTVLALFERSTCSELELSCSRYSLKLKRPMEGEPIREPARPAARIPVAENPKPQEIFETITSPIVGTFYLTPAPDAPPYVQTGTKVEQGQVVCTIEAMKLMNQLETEFPCEIVEILAKPEAMVEYGQPLFKVKRL